MFNLSKILVPVDFSERSATAARYAGIVACRFRSEVTLLHVVPRTDYPVAWADAPASFDNWWDGRAAAAQNALDGFLADDFRSMPVQRILLDGDPAVRIVELAHSSGTNLIVMPTHGYGPFRRFILGSVTAKVLHDADCPVLTGIHMENGPAPDKPALFRNILCAVDLGPQSQAVLAWAAQMAAKVDAELHLVHVLPPEDAGQARYFDHLALQQLAKEQITALQEKAGVHASLILDSGQISSCVHRAVESVNANLVVIGRHVNSGILGRLRAHAYAIIRESPCPVVSV